LHRSSDLASGRSERECEDAADDQEDEDGDAEIR
jgi:hypothetical protein